jgi:hypothetical protein
MVNASRSLPLVLLSAALSLAAPTAAEDAPGSRPSDALRHIHCPSAPPQAIRIDGIALDWEAIVEPVERAQTLVEGEYRYDWTGPVDASYRIWCRATTDSLLLAAMVRDNVIVGPRAGDAGDEFELLMEIAPDEILRVRVPVHDLDGGVAMPVDEDGDPIPGAAGAVAPRDTGFFLEIAVPVPAPFAPIPLASAFRDIDRDTERERTAVVAPGDFERDDPSTWPIADFGVADELLDSLLLHRGRTRSDVALDTFVDVGGSSALDRVFLLGQEVFVSGRGLGGFDWASMDLATGDRVSDVSLTTQDLDADGDAELFVRFSLPRYNATIDDVVTHRILAVYDVGSTGIVRIIAQELGRMDSHGNGYLSEPVVSPSRSRPRMVVPRSESVGAGAEDWAASAPLDVGGPTPAPAPWDDRERLEWTRDDNGAWGPAHQE